MKKILAIILATLLSIPVLALAINITVPSASTSKLLLISTTTGAYVTTSTTSLTSLLTGFATGTNFWTGSLGGTINNLNTGNVGIGVASPASTLDVRGELRITNPSAVGGRMYLNGNSLVFDTIGADNFQVGSNVQSFDMSAMSVPRIVSRTKNLNFGVDLTSLGDTNVMTIQTATGNVGIGTTTPLTTLSLQGKGGTNPFTIASSTGSTLLTVLQNGSVGIGTISPLSSLDVNGGTVIGSYAGSNVAPSNGLAVSGNVGIGTSTPTEKLDIVNGSSGDTPNVSLDRMANTAQNRGFGFIFKSSGVFKGGLIQDKSNDNTNIWNPSAKVLTLTPLYLVGIGTSTPRAVLHAIASSTSVTTLAAQATTSQTASVLDVWGSTGSSLFNVFPNGNVGIASTTPAAQLGIVGSSTGSAPIFLIASTSNSTVLTVLNSGKIGVRTNSPQGMFHIDSPDSTIGNAAVVISSTNQTDFGRLNFLGTSGVAGVINKSNGGDLYFGEAADTGNYNFRGGNVGVGIVSAVPTSKLFVNQGEVRIVASSSPVGDTYAARATSLVFSRSDLGTVSTYRNKITNSWSGVTTDNSMNFEVSNSAGTTNTIMSLIGSGNVGIGATAPPVKLQVSSSAVGNMSVPTPLLQFSTGSIFTQTPNTLQEISSDNTTNATDAAIGLNLENRIAVVGAYSPLITFSRIATSGSYTPSFAYIGGVNTGDGPDTNWSSGDLTFATANSTFFGPREKMRLTSAGNLGLATTTPAARLDVYGAAGTADIFNFSSSTNTSYFKLKSTGMLIVNGATSTVATSTGIGTGASSAAVTGMGNGGVITITTGTLPTGANATVLTLTYPSACPTDSAITYSPGNSNAAALSGSGSVFFDGTASTAVLKSGSTALVGATQYIWNYQVICW